MIDYFESSVRIHPSETFFTFVEHDSTTISYTYWQARLVSASLARRLQAAGFRSGDIVSIDLPNGPEFVFVALACAYCGFTMALFDHGLSEPERASRILEIERSGRRIACHIDEALASQLLRNVRRLPADESEIVRGIYSPPRHDRAIMGANQDAIDDTVHFAERESHLFDRNAIAVIVFDGGKGQGRDKRLDKFVAVPLTWANLLDASAMANDSLAAGAVRLWQERLPLNSINLTESGRITRLSPEAVWQCALPLSWVDGFQVMVRSLVARSPFRLYTGRDVEPILCDSERGIVSHIAVNDALLQDILTVEEWRADAIPGIASRLAQYRCVILIGRVNNARTIMRAYELGCRIFASYGLPQTSGTVATALMTEESHGGIVPMEGYELRIVDPDEDGLGRLSVRGPGVFGGYLNTRTAFTVDHFFITDEKAFEQDGYIYVCNRSDNMFVSAGQNIYPAEIADVLRHVAGVSGVHVFGVPDARSGMLPIAVIERSDPSLTADTIETLTRQWFSSITAPISVFVFDQLPRTSQGRLDRGAIEAIFR